MKTMRVKIVNSTGQAKAVPRHGGLVTVPARGQVVTDILSINDDKIAFYARHGLKIMPVSGDAQKEKTTRKKAAKPSEGGGTDLLTSSDPNQASEQDDATEKSDVSDNEGQDQGQFGGGDDLLVPNDQVAPSGAPA